MVINETSRNVSTNLTNENGLSVLIYSSQAVYFLQTGNVSLYMTQNNILPFELTLFGLLICCK
jgi:hypothetical protein